MRCNLLFLQGIPTPEDPKEPYFGDGLFVYFGYLVAREDGPPVANGQK